MSSPPKRADSISSSSGRPASPSPARSFRTRMSTAVRRASTGLSFSQVGKLSRSSSKASLKVDPSQSQAPSEDAHLAPSPVAESPAREALATAEDVLQPVAPSPLANVTTAADVVTETPSAPTQSVSEPSRITASPEQEPIALSSQAPEPAPEPFGFSDPILPTVAVAAPTPEERPAVSVQDAPATSEPVQAPLPESTPEPTPQASLPAPSSEPPVPSAIDDRRPDYFSFSDPVVPQMKAEAAEATHSEPHPALPEPAAAVFSSEETLRTQEVTHVQIPTDASTFAWSEEPALGHKASRSSFSEPVHSTEASQSGLHSVSPKASKSSLASSFGQLLPNQTRGRSSSVRFSMNTDDPFADHYGIPTNVEVPKTGLSPIPSVHNMPEPAVMPQPVVVQDGEPAIHDSPAPLRFPLPPFQDVVASQATRQKAASAYSLGERDGASLAETHHLDMDERIPLLHASQRAAPSRGKTTHVVATFATGPITTEMAASRTLQTLGWVEYTLPDSSQYYHHPNMRVTTDIELRDPRHLQRVTEYLEKTVSRDTSLPPNDGWELWLKNTASIKPDFKPEQCWVNHDLRIMTGVPPPMISGDGVVIERFSEDDKLDMEYRYWCFIESHPAHVPLAAETHTEALDALKWSYTDSLLPVARPAPPPFAPQECQELMNLLRSFDETSNTALVVHSRVVSRVLLRIAQWRQTHFRPNKPLPRDAIKGVKDTPKPISRALMDFIIGCLCLGIPYIFLSRTYHQSFDEESGLYSAGPMLMVSACACLVAAVILSASVTFLSLPQLDDVPRLAGFLAIAFSASSMVSAVIALFRYKTEIDRTIVYLGGEGLMVLSRRSIIFSLPLVFLAWAIAAFMTGITLYSFRGATVSNPAVVRQPFEAYTHWAVIGTLGALGGMLTIATIAARR